MVEILAHPQDVPCNVGYNTNGLPVRGTEPFTEYSLVFSDAEIADMSDPVRGNAAMFMVGARIAQHALAAEIQADTMLTLILRASSVQRVQLTTYFPPSVIFEGYELSMGIRHAKEKYTGIDLSEMIKSV